MRYAVLDTNIFLVMIIGRGGEDRIRDHKRLDKEIGIARYRFMAGRLTAYDKICITPHVLAETSNFIRGFHFDDGTKAQSAFQDLRIVVGRSVEIYDSGRDIVVQPEFKWLGVADAGLLMAAGDPGRIYDRYRSESGSGSGPAVSAKATLFTIDANLEKAALDRGIHTVNPNHFILD